MQGNIWLPIAVVLPLLGAPAAYALGRRQARHALFLLAGISAAVFAVLTWVLWGALHGRTSVFAWEAFGVGGLSLAADGFRALLAWLAALLWTASSMFSLSYFEKKHGVPRYAFFTLVTLSAVIGVFISDQLLTTIVFFEIMSLSSYPWVAQEETPEALRAAQTYLWIAVIGGLCLLLGMLLLPSSLLSARYSAGRPATDGIAASRLFAPAALMLVGFGAKAGAAPLHVWLPKAHPVAPAPASALLSGILLKTGVFGVLILSGNFLWASPAWHTLIFWLGVVTMVAGAVLALLSVEMKRILACSSMSQIGFILLGAGLYGLLQDGGGVAAQGLVGHMVNHALFKLILFLCAGIAALQSPSLHLNALRGFGRGKPLFHFIFLCALLGLAGVPLFSGYASKTLLHEGLTLYIGTLSQGAALYRAAEWLFILSGALTAAYSLKLYVCVFWERGAKPCAVPRVRYASKSSAALLSVCAAAVVLLGVFPSVFMDGVGRLSAGFLHTKALPGFYFTAEALRGAAVTIGIGAALYGLVVRGLLSEKTASGRIYFDRKPAWLDLEDRVYRPLFKALAGFVSACGWALASLPEWIFAALRRALLRVRAWRVPMPGGNRFTWALGSLLNGVVALLNQTVRRRNPFDVDFCCILAAGNEEINQSMRRLKRSMSYSLLLFCVGLFLLLFYLVIW